MINKQVTELLNKMQGIWTGLDSHKNKNKYKEYGEYMIPLDYNRMVNCIKEYQTTLLFLPKISELNQLYFDTINLEKQLEHEKIEKERAEKISKGEYVIECMVCLDHGLIMLDRKTYINKIEQINTFSFYCDKCELGESKKVYYRIRNKHGKKVREEMVDTPISQFRNPDDIAERNSIRFQDAELKQRPPIYYERILREGGE